jgi:site-specific DNA-methyltransferase (adenine-specific)
MNISEWLEAGKPWNVILHGDCMDLMKHFKDNEIQLCIVDPPYGIGMDGQKLSICKNPKHNRKEHKKKSWDNKIPDKKYFEELFRISQNQIIWGGNYFTEYLKPVKAWVIWDKGQYGLTMSDGEMAWTSFDSVTRIKKINRVELLKDGSIHPTQKPDSPLSLAPTKLRKTRRQDN